MQSPLSGFCEVLKEVKRRAREYPPRNETQTRMALIDPVLVALGWDLTNPRMVELEKHYGTPREQRIVDYMLKAENEIIIEAKKLGADLEEHFDQIALYANRARVKNLFLTDGRTWRHYVNSHLADDSTQHGIHFVSVKEIKLHEIDDVFLSRDAAAYLVAHLDASFFIRDHGTKAIEKELITQIAELKTTIDEISTAVRNLSAGRELLPPPDPEPDVRSWKLLRDNEWDPTGKSPTRLRLVEGQEIEVNGWKQVLWEVCQFCLISKPELMNHPIPDKAGRSRSLIGPTRPPNSSKMLTINGQDIYVDTNYSASDTVKNAVHMLEKMEVGTVSRVAVLLANNDH
jgi:hypothetical protein